MVSRWNEHGHRNKSLRGFDDNVQLPYLRCIVLVDAMTAIRKREDVICFCGSTASLRSNALIYAGKTYGNGKAYICDRFPACRGSVGTHPDGRPLGIIPDTETKRLRIQLHAMIDPLWKDNKKRRGSVYGWLKRITGGTKEVHMGETTKEDCLRLIELIKQNPYEVAR